MSADNWAICPRCKSKRVKAADAAQRKADDAYGKVDVEEFDRLRSEARRMAAEAISESHDYRTFREDYEIYGAEDGEVVIRYSGGCTRCDLSLTVESEHPLPIEADR